MITRLTTFAHQATGYMQQTLLDALSESQKRIAAIVAGALALLAAAYVAYRFCWKKEEVQAKKEEKAIAPSPKLEIKKQEETEKAESLKAPEPTPPVVVELRAIPRIGSGGSIMHYDRDSIERLFELVNAKDLLELDDKENREAVDDFVKLVQDDDARRNDFENKPRAMRIELYERHATEQPKELAAKGCHFHIKKSEGSWNMNFYREMAISHNFLKSFTEAEGNKDQAKLKELVLKVVEEMKEAYELSKEERKAKKLNHI